MLLRRSYNQMSMPIRWPAGLTAAPPGFLRLFAVAARRDRRRIATSASSPANDDALFLSTVWPERSSSAAGVRTSDLVGGLFLERGWRVAYGATAAPNDHTALLQQQGARALQVPLNREAEMLEVLAQARPAVVWFDRFFAEEMFSFRVRQAAPGALRVLDMQDMHFLREGRQQLVKAGAGMEEVMACRPDASSPAALRELSAIHRSDLTLVCSPAELQMLTQHYRVPAAKLALAPFFVPPPAAPAAHPAFAQRQHFVMIGNWMHPPNLDSARWACAEVWPALRRRLAAGGAAPELHLWGAYPPAAAQQLHAPAKGVHFKGFAPSLDIMLQYRVCLAPMRFGAGLKGKIVDSWRHGLPVCTTPVGSEGMEAAGAGWGGLHGAATAEEVAVDAARLYTDEALWSGCRDRGFELLSTLYDRQQRLDAVDDAIREARRDLQARRAVDFTQAMLWQQGTRATEYLSRWIELKERLAAQPAAPDRSAHEP